MKLAAKIKVPVSTSSSDGLLGNLKSPVTPSGTECPAQDSTRLASSSWVEVAAQIGDNLFHVGRVHDGPIRGNEVMINFGLASLSALLLLTSASLPKIVVPHFSDLKIKTRITFDRFSTLQTLYLKGGRERMETDLLTSPGSAGQIPASITIYQCDQGQSFQLNPAAKTYALFEMKAAPGRINGAKPVSAGELRGADVHVRINSVDTGERKQIESYTARHIKITTTVMPGPEASTPSSVEERDGWYIDLPGLGCSEYIVESRLSALTTDRFYYEQVGTGKRGYPLEETTRKTQGGLNECSRVELLEFSVAPLDSNLFGLPAGYSPALRTLHGSYDMSKPDTLRNRAQEYWAELMSATRRIFR